MAERLSWKQSKVFGFELHSSSTGKLDNHATIFHVVCHDDALLLIQLGSADQAMSHDGCAGRKGRGKICQLGVHFAVWCVFTVCTVLLCHCHASAKSRAQNVRK